MKQRTTYLVSDPEATNPDNFELSPGSLYIKTLPAAREDRLTLAFHELPPEIWNVLKQCHELHVRWSTGKPYESVDPYGSRVPAGLHVFLTSQRDAAPSVCDLLSDVFGINDCKSFEKSFTEIPGAYQFYSPLPSISHFRSYVEELVCGTGMPECKDQIGSVELADYIDLRYDAISQSLIINTFRSRPAKPWRETLQPVGTHKNIEVGVLGNEKPIAAESLTLGGFLHVVGKDDKLEPVWFTLESRHFRFPAKYSLTALEPTGLHPRLRLSIPSSPPAPGDDCTLNAYFTLPRGLFVDKYQLGAANSQLLKSLNIKRLRPVIGETDLEEPVWASDLWGSSVLVEIDTDRPTEKGGLDVEVPLHLRYFEPQHNSTESKVRFAMPSVFWACRSEKWSKMGNSPFDRPRLGWEYQFPEPTMYYHLSPAEDAWKSIKVPILDSQHAVMVEYGTIAVIMCGFFWICLKALAAVMGGKRNAAKKTQ